MAYLASIILRGTTRATLIEPISVRLDQRALPALKQLNALEDLTTTGIAWLYHGFWVVMAPARDRGGVFDISMSGHPLEPDAVLIVISNYTWPKEDKQWPVVDLDLALSKSDRWVLTYNMSLAEVYPTPPPLLRDTVLDYAKQRPDRLGVDKIPNIIHSIEDDIAWRAAADAYCSAQLHSSST